MKECATCHAQLTGKQRKYCDPECRTIGNSHHDGVRAGRDRDGLTRFVGIDGEGVTDDDGDHRYVLLSIGERSITASDTGGALWGERLQWWEIFRFIHDYQVEFPGDVMVGFFLGYDFAQWFRTLPEVAAKAMLTVKGMAERTSRTPHAPPTTVKLYDYDGVQWEFDYLPKRRFKVRPVGHKTWAYVMDTGAFWQTSLLNAINPARWETPIVTDEEYAVLCEGKERRATAQLDKAMIRYNVLENDVLARMMRELDRAFTRVGVKLGRNQWFGPGQAAQLWMIIQHVIETEDAKHAVPSVAWNAAEASYYGGWFDRMVHGTVPTLHEYDINSAYPFAASRLPCLEHGRWSENGGEVPTPGRGLTLVYIRATSQDPYIGCGLMWRAKDGSISTPQQVEGWYWHHEVIAAQLATGMAYAVERWVNYAPCDCRPPLHRISELYDLRYKVGKNTAEGIAIKLILNSIYGKFAQMVGGPRFHNPVYASLITSGCRTMILHAIASHPEGSKGVAMVATDGVYFMSEHPTLALSETTLGLWDHKVKTNTTIFLPGMYWDDKARDALRDGKTVAFKARGVKASFLAPHIARIDEQFRSLGETGVWPQVTIPIPFAMTTPTQALAWGKWSKAGTITTDGTRTLDSTPTPKRLGEPFVDGGIVRTVVAAGTGGPSAPHTTMVVEDVDVDAAGQVWNSAMREWMHGE